jgi:hypothetical protein
MSTSDRNAFGFDDPNRGPLDRAANALDGHDDPTRGPVDRATNALGMHDDPNRGPLDRATNALTGHDDPNRGPLDRTANALSGHDDPNRGPLDRAANAVTGGTGGVSAAMGHGSTSGSTTSGSTGRVASAMFDSQSEAQQAVAALRQAGISDGALSVIAQKGRTMTTRDADGEITDEEHTNVLRGILGGGALGAGLGVAALAIPGVGPLAALGAIAASAVPEAMAIGAAVGATAGTFNEVLLKHGVDEHDAKYYGEGMKNGGVLVTVDGGGEQARDILYRNGGHSASRQKMATA